VSDVFVSYSRRDSEFVARLAWSIHGIRTLTTLEKAASAGAA
jgi:hypothetical protein